MKKVILYLMLLVSTAYTQDKERLTLPTNPEPVLVSQQEELAKWLKETGQKTQGFVEKESPLFVQEYLAWEARGCIITILIVSLIFIVFVTILTVSLYQLRKSDKDQFWDSMCVFNGFGTGVSTLILVIAVPISIMKLIKVQTAPRVVVAEKMKDLLR